MIQKPQMKRNKDILATEKDVKKARASLEMDTEEVFREFDRCRREVMVLARLKGLD